MHAPKFRDVFFSRKQKERLRQQPRRRKGLVRVHVYVCTYTYIYVHTYTFANISKSTCWNMHRTSFHVSKKHRLEDQYFQTYTPHSYQLRMGVIYMYLYTLFALRCRFREILWTLYASIITLGGDLTDFGLTWNRFSSHQCRWYYPNGPISNRSK